MSNNKDDFEKVEKTNETPRFTKGLFTILFIVTSLTIGYQVVQLLTKTNKPIDPHVFFVMPDQKPVPEVTLEMAGKGNISTQEFKGKWHLLYFGYTFCPDVCPVELTALHDMYAQLETKIVKEKLPQVVFISIDPKRDSPKRTMEYAHYFDPNFIGITGKPDQLLDLGDPLGIAWFKEKNANIQAKASDKNYIISHSTTILLVNPKGKVVGFFPAPHDSSKMAEVYTQLINQ